LLASLKTTEINIQLDRPTSPSIRRKETIPVQAIYSTDSVGTLEQLQNAKTTGFAKQARMLCFSITIMLSSKPGRWFVSGKVANEGEVVAPGIPVFYDHETGGNKDWVYVVGARTLSGRHLPGQKAPIRLDAFPDLRFAGESLPEIPSADQASGAFSVDIQINFRKGCWPPACSEGCACSGSSDQRKYKSLTKL